MRARLLAGMSKRHRWVRPVMGAVVVVLLGLQLGAASAEPRDVLVASIDLSPDAYDVTLPDKLGVLEASEHRVQSFETPGRLEAVAAEGRSIAAGLEVARLDADLERSRVRQAELQLRDARSQLQRIAGLKRSEVASEKAHEDAVTAVGLREAELDAAREQLERKTLRAPFDGVIAETLADPGEVVGAGTPIAMLMQFDALVLSVGVPGYQVGRVRKGAEVSVSVPALPDERFPGVVDRVAPAAAEGRHLFEVEILVPNAQGRLRPGMSARAAIVTNTLQHVVVAPLEAVVERSGKRTVFLVESGRVRALDVADAPLHGDHVLIAISGEGVELVVRGQQALRDGTAVRVDNTILRAVDTAR
ncbi:MAG: efflux RND transporter periplasmic adaptor subunit [bacterium]|nr:efflux RND transporter periplasmic adaptor subunit [bacterium]